ncbi:MAG: ankyrin repeat domain-containing protein [SAR324 cluster bacterium]|nr:ankyrin repeat domain-containing protein [SAR324 cluster bacterium]
MRPFLHSIYPLFIFVLLTASHLFAGDLENQFIQAATAGDTAQIEKLLKQKVQIDATDLQNKTALIAALQNKHDDVANLLISKGASVNISGASVTPLIVSAWTGNLGLTQVLLKNGANVNDSNAHGLTPLLAAAGKGHTAIVKMLLDHGADVNAINTYGLTPLKAARNGGFIPIVKLIEKTTATKKIGHNNDKKQ